MAGKTRERVIAETYGSRGSNHKARKSADIKDRRIDILEAARAQIIEDGYGKLTMRAIASRCGIHLKTLQHYFGTKRQLLLETVNYTLDTYYHNDFMMVADQIHNSSPKASLSKTVKDLIADWKREETAKFFQEFWALASRDPDACDAMDTMYTRHRRQIEILVMSANTGLSGKEVKLRAALVVAQIEGLMLLIGHGKPKHAELNDLAKEAHDRILEYVLS